MMTLLRNSFGQWFCDDGSPPTPRRGVSLIELLVVMVLILMVSVITLRTIQPALTNRRTREAARMVSVFISSARQRAMETNRPAGVWVERMQGLPEACVSLSYAHVPEPYAGDFLDSTLEAFCIPPWTVQNRQTQQYFVNVVTPRAGTNASLAARQLDTWCTANSSLQNLVRPNDQLRINFQGIKYTLNTIQTLDPLWKQSPFNSHPLNTPPQGPAWIVGIGANKTTLSAGAYSNTKYPYTGEYVLTWFGVPPNAPIPIVTYGSSASMPLGKSVPYQIIRQPQKSASGALQLPEGTVIDLNYSGDVNTPFQPRFVAGDTANGLAANAFRGTALDYFGTPLDPSNPSIDVDTKPIIMMFNPDGSMEQLYHRIFDSGSQTWMWMSERPFNTIYFLVGKREKVPITVNIPKTFDTWQNQMNYNYADPTNLWVAVIPRTGLIVSAEASLMLVQSNYATLIDAKAQVATSRTLVNTLVTQGGK